MHYYLDYYVLKRFKLQNRQKRTFLVLNNADFCNLALQKPKKS